MLFLVSTSDKVQVITGSAGAVAVHGSYLDNDAGVITPGRINETSITTAATTDIIDPPGSSIQRTVENLTVRNTHASVSNLITIQHTDGTTIEILWKGTLAVGTGVIMDAFGRFNIYDVLGPIRAPEPLFRAIVRTFASYASPAQAVQFRVPELSVFLKSGKKYAFFAFLYYTTSATTNGPRAAVGGVTVTSLKVATMMAQIASATAATIASQVQTAVDTLLTAQTSGPGATNTPALIQGFIQPSANGVFYIAISPETTGAMTLLAGSALYVMECNN